MSNKVSSLDTLCMPMPMKLGQRRGVESLASNGKPIALRINDADLQLLHQEARALGLTRSELLRWLCVQGGAALHLRRTGQTVKVVP